MDGSDDPTSTAQLHRLSEKVFSKEIWRMLKEFKESMELNEQTTNKNKILK